MCSGRSQVLKGSPEGQPEDAQPGDHGDQPEEAQLPVGKLHRLAEGLAPESRGDEGQHALEHEQQRDPRRDDFAHGRYLPRPGLLKYLKKSELGSSTITSLFVRMPWRYASMLR